MRRSRVRIAAAAVATVATVSPAMGAGGSLAGEVFARPKSDRSSTSIGVSISEEELTKLPASSRTFNEILFSVPGVQPADVSAGHLPNDWTFHPRDMSATGPAIGGGHFRLDVPLDWKPRNRMQVELRNDGRSIWKDKVDIEVRDPIEVSRDVSQYLDLPRTLHAGSELALPSGTANKWGADLSWNLDYLGTYRLPAGSDIDREWKLDDKQVFTSNFYLSGLSSYVGGGFRPFPIEGGRPVAAPRTEAGWRDLWPENVGFFAPAPGTSGRGREFGSSAGLYDSVDLVRPRVPDPTRDSFWVPSYGSLYDRSRYQLPLESVDQPIRLGAPRSLFELRGTDPYGETVVRDYWNPVLLPPLFPGLRPEFTGITEIVAPHETFCVTGRVEVLDQWNDLQIGGTGLGAPIFATNSSAVFLPPVNIAPGVHRISYVPWGDTNPDTGLSTAYIAIHARIHKQTIKTGNKTQLTLEIVGTDRAFPVMLENKSPEIINLEGKLEHHDVTTGGAENKVDKEILGLTPGNYDIYYEVELPTCPGEEPELRAADAGDAFVQGLAEWSNSLGGTPSASGAAPDAVTPPDLANPGFTLGGPIVQDKLWYWGSFDQRKVGSTPGCAPAANTLTLNDDRFQVKVDFRDFEPASGGACVNPQTDDTGLFYFFNPDNWEMLVKVLDGCDFNNRFWVFSAGATNVEYTMTVTDTQTGAVQSYFNPLGQAAPAITDTSAFATCP